MYLIALTGGIASGKSTVGKRFEALGAVRIDADELAREAVERGSDGLAQVVERFGEGILLPDGGLDRAALGELVFRDPEALGALNGIVHPEVRRLALARIDAAAAQDPGAVVVYEIPLFVETGMQPPRPGRDWDAVVTTDAPDEHRLQRMVELRGMEPDDAARRIANQATNADRRAAADIVIDTSLTLERTLDQVDRAWQQLIGDGDGGAAGAAR